MLQQTMVTPARTARVQTYLNNVGSLTDLVAASSLVADKKFLIELTKTLGADAEFSGRPSWSYFVNAPYAFAHGTFIAKLGAACDIYRDVPLSPKIAILRDVVIGTAPGASDDAFRIFDGLYDGHSKVFRRSVSATDKLAIFAAICQRLCHPGRPLHALEPSRMSADFIPLKSIRAVDATLTLH